MAMYNADGSRGEMCGNGIRCVAKYVYDYGLTDKTKVSIETLAGIKYIDMEVQDGKMKTAKVNMGSPILCPSEIPVTIGEKQCVNEPLIVEGKRVSCNSGIYGKSSCRCFCGGYCITSVGKDRTGF